MSLYKIEYLLSNDDLLIALGHRFLTGSYLVAMVPHLYLRGSWNKELSSLPESTKFIYITVSLKSGRTNCLFILAIILLCEANDDFALFRHQISRYVN
jgi:hypothetical protein